MGILSFLSYPNVTLSLHPNLTFKTLFHPQFECSRKLSEIGYYLMELGINFQTFLQEFVLTRFHSMKNLSSMKAQIRSLRVSNYEESGPIYDVRKTVWLSCFRVCCFHMLVTMETLENCTKHMLFLHALVVVECGELLASKATQRFGSPILCHTGSLHFRRKFLIWLLFETLSTTHYCIVFLF